MLQPFQIRHQSIDMSGSGAAAGTASLSLRMIFGFFSYLVEQRILLAMALRR